jgi:CHAT domain-containing protein
MRGGRRIWAFIVSMLLGVISTLSLPMLAVQPVGVSNSTAAQSPNLSSAQPADAESRLKQGIDLYEAERFSEAVEVWQAALAAFAVQGDRETQALVLSNLSLAYQQLGRWQEATSAIASSLALLQTEAASTNLAILAKALNTQARLQWFNGEIETALETWERATATYDRAGDETGTVIGLLNQAKALQALGFSVRAEAQLDQVNQMLQRQADPELKATGLRSLGDALRRVGKLNESLRVLQVSLQTALTPAAQSSTRLNLGNTERALANKAASLGEAETARHHAEAAMAFYQQAAELVPSTQLALEAQLNQLSLQLEQGRSAPASLISIIQPQLATLPLGRSAIYAQLNFAHSLMNLNDQDRGLEGRDKIWTETAQLLAMTIQQARLLNDLSAESYGLGQLGKLYEQTQQWAEAKALTEQALLQAEQAPYIRYRWEWQLGRLLEKQGDQQGAIAAYSAAVKTLQTLRNDLLLISSDLQFSFRDDVEPIYRGLVQLLLSSTVGQPSQENLKQALQQVNALQLTELENFLGCNLAQTVAIDQVEVDPTAAKIYPMILPDRLAVVLELPGQSLQYHAVLKPRQDVEATLQGLRQDLSAADRTPEAIEKLQQVYQWLIAPFQSVLASNSQISTLVFVLDGQLRNIPMAALYDGKQYLISRYAVAVAPRLELFQPSPRPQKFKVFLGGIGEPQTLDNRTFPKIEYLNPELDQIKQLVNANQPLLNAEFTETRLEQQLSKGSFSAIHLKTHGIFSSDPEGTFIVAYQELITGRELGRLVQTDRTGTASSIELLVLSACSTAQGDNRAVLGLAGIAVQAGARSVISTLWEAQDLPNTQLMVRFYQELLDPSTTRAAALRKAQLQLLAQGYSTPHVWATYVLVGNWL